MLSNRWLLTSTAGLCLLMASGCHARSAVPSLSPDPALTTFVQELVQNLEAHAWGEILAAADPDHHRIQVVEHGMAEPQYVAELFGLHDVDNNIRRGASVTWPDLERIERVVLQELVTVENGYTLTGEVRLAGGERLQLQASIVQRQGRFRLSGAVG